MSAPAFSQQTSGPAPPRRDPDAPPTSSATGVPGGTAASVMKNRAGTGLPAAPTDPALLYRLIRSLPVSSFPDLTLPASGSDGNRHRPRPRRRAPQPHKSTSVTTPWNDTLSPMPSQLPAPQPGRPATNAPAKDDVELPPELRDLLRTLSWQYHCHPTIIDISIAVGVVAYSLIVTIPLPLQLSNPMKAYPILFLVLITIALIGIALSLRRRFPLWCWTAILLIPKTYQFVVLQAFHLSVEQLMHTTISISGIGLISIPTVLGAIVSHHKPSVAWIAGGISLVVLIMGIVLMNSGPAVREVLCNVAILILLILVGIPVGSNTRSARPRLKAIGFRSAQMALASEQTVLLAAAEERSRITREMRDIVTHPLAIMITMAGGAAAIMEHDSATTKQVVGALAEVGRNILADTHRLVGVLREDPPAAAKQAPQSPEPPTPSGESPSSARQYEVRGLSVPEFAPLGVVMPVEPSVPTTNLHQQTADDVSDRSRRDLPLASSPERADTTELVKRFVAAGVPATYRWVGATFSVGKALQLTAFRIVQEALTNVLCYAPTIPAVSADVEWHNGTVVLTMNNEAAPSARPIHGSGKGLIDMRGRASVCGGTVQAGPAPTG